MGKKRRKHIASPAPVASAQPPRAKISDHLLALARTGRPHVDVFRAAEHPPGCAPRGMAMDDALSAAPMAWAQAALASYASEGLAFLGYPMLSEMAQRPEYRRIVETISRHMTRKWIRLRATGDEDKSGRIAELEDALSRFRVQQVFREAAEHDGYFGRGHIFIDLGDDSLDEVNKPLGSGYEKVGIGSLQRLRTIEPVWIYPQGYNASDPLSKDWYRPKSWFVLGKSVHQDRLLTLVGREVPDLLKPAYSFGGLSLSQMARPYVDNWLRTRQSVADIVSAFSVFVLKTNMAEKLMMSGEDIVRRAELFNYLRDNRGLMMIDKEMEEFANVSAPLSGLSELQAQAQEHVASIAAIPLVEYTGIAPSGLNASSEGELETFYNSIHAMQENLFREPLRRIIEIVQLSEFGDIDEEITFDFEPLKVMSEREQAEIRKIDADTDAAYIDMGVIAPEEVRKKVGEDEDMPYQGLDIEDMPDPPAPPPSEFGGQPPGEEGSEKSGGESDFGKAE